MRTIKEYCQNTTIHGFSYLTSNIGLIEKTFWIITLIISLIFTTTSIIDLILRAQKLPIIISLSDVEIPVSDVYFPAVTVCPPLNLNITGFNYEDIVESIENGDLTFDNLTMDELKFIQVIDLIHKDDFLFRYNVSVPTDDFRSIVGDFPFFFYRMGKPRSIDRADRATMMNLFASWQKLYRTPMALILTEWGYCYSFNIANYFDLIDFSNASKDLGYLRLITSLGFQDLQEAFPWRTSLASKGLKTEFYKYYEEEDKTQIVNHKSQVFEGFHLIIHDPFELPTRDSSHYHAMTNSTVVIWIKVEASKVIESLYDFSPADRDCYLSGEKNLTFFKVYTKTNCEQECLSDYTLNVCNCVQFFMIRNSSTRVCSSSERKCFEKADNDFYLKHVSSCHCYQTCNNIKYTTEFDIKLLNTFTSSRQNVKYEVYFTENSYKVLLKQKHFQIVDFLSFFGGLLGLYTGFSALSFVEIFYYILIPTAWRNKNERKISPEANKVAPKKFFNKITRGICCGVSSYACSYLRESSIHGFNYIFKARSIGKIFWITAFGFSVAGCRLLVLELVEKFKDDPIIFSYDDLGFRMTKFPFPAVTFVNEMYMNKTEWWLIDYLEYSYRVNTERKIRTPYFDFENGFKDPQRLERALLDYGICVDRYSYYNRFEYNMTYLIVDHMKKFSPKAWFANQSATWNKRYEPAFAEMFTRQGMGFTFNMIDPSSLFNENHVSQDFLYKSYVYARNNFNKTRMTPELYPLQSSVDKAGLTIVLKRSSLDLNEWKSCVEKTFVVHAPTLLPASLKRDDFRKVQYGKTYDVTITPEVTRTDDDLRSVDPAKRLCYFEDEIKLKYFKSYTQKNCELECVSDYSYWACKCVAWYMVRDSMMDICPEARDELSMKSCTGKVEDIAFDSGMWFFKVKDDCKCYPACNQFVYHEKYRIRTHSRDENETVLNFKMDSENLLVLRRHRLLTLYDLISYVGGLVALFTGISFLSVFEFCHFATFRIVTNIWIYCRAKIGQN